MTGRRPCVLAASRPWYAGMAERLAARTGVPFHAVDSREGLTADLLDQWNPLFVFIPHWSWIIPEDIWSRHECVIFHMTDLPFGRGGSPLQNLIARGLTETKVTALRCEAGLDSGPVYLKRDLALYGSAEEIFLRLVPVVEEMIVHILEQRPEPVPQVGPVTTFQRRTPEQGNLAGLDDLQTVYDTIRMLDAEGYPPAFLETGTLRLEFRRAGLRHGRIEAEVVVTLKDRGKPS